MSDPINFSGNKGEWSEIYIFLKLLDDGKIYAADKNLNRIPSVYLNIIKIIREEIKGRILNYYPGSVIKITIDSGGGENDLGPSLSKSDYEKAKDAIWSNISTAKYGNSIKIPSVDDFLSKIHITKLKSPATSNSNYFGGTEDITLQIQDYRSGMSSVLGFSCKSDFSAKSTLFNASQDNTNFVYKINGPMNDGIMDDFNTMVDSKGHAAIRERIKFLKSKGMSLCFRGPVKQTALRNLVLSGGKEMPAIVGGMLKYYYWENEGKTFGSEISSAIDYLVATDPAQYRMDDLRSIYEHKVGDLLLCMFTGMRLSKNWDGKSSVNGGYIVVKNDGDVLAYHSIIADQFKEFLISQLGFESPSTSRHNYLSIYKEGINYLINLNLQVRFRGN